jgi:hypothetical protein
MSLPYLHLHPWLGGFSGTVSFGTRFRVNPGLLLESPPPRVPTRRQR